MYICLIYNHDRISLSISPASVVIYIKTFEAHFVLPERVSCLLRTVCTHLDIIDLRTNCLGAGFNLIKHTIGTVRKEYLDEKIDKRRL